MGDWRYSFRARPLALRKRVFGNNSIADWVGHTVRVDAFKNRMFLPIARNRFSIS